jgi:hypothetical protein
LQQRFEFGDPHGEAFHGAAATKSSRLLPGTSGMSVTAANSVLSFSLAWMRSAILASCLKSPGARVTERVCTTARAVAPVTVVDAQGIAGESPLLGAHGFFTAFPEVRLAENL